MRLTPEEVKLRFSKKHIADNIKDLVENLAEQAEMARALGLDVSVSIRNDYREANSHYLSADSGILLPVVSSSVIVRENIDWVSVKGCEEQSEATNNPFEDNSNKDISIEKKLISSLGRIAKKYGKL